jgi:hypothetical protein
MSWMMGLGGGGGGGKQPSPLIATSGKWLATFIALYATIFWTVDLWRVLEPRLVVMIYDRYDGGLALFIYWLLRLAAYPLMFFGVRLVLGLVSVSTLLAAITKFFGRRP